MRHPQILTYDTDGRLASWLRPVAEAHRWSLREPRRVESFLRLLARRGPAIVVIRAGRDLEREFSLLERIAWLHPEAAVVIVVEAAELRGPAWDLGASFVVSAQLARERLPEVVEALLEGQCDAGR